MVGETALSNEDFADKPGQIKSYRDLVIWQKGIELAEVIYQVTSKFPTDERFGLVNQLRRAAVSVPSNIAEGQTRNHTREFVQFLYVSLGSLSEIDTQLTIAQRMDYLDEQLYAGIGDRLVTLKKMIYALINSLAQRI